LLSRVVVSNRTALLKEALYSGANFVDCPEDRPIIAPSGLENRPWGIAAMGKLGNQSDRERGGLRFTVPELKRLLRVAQGVGLPVLGYEVDPATGKLLEPIQEERIHAEWFGRVKRRSMMRIMARRKKAATVRA